MAVSKSFAKPYARALFELAADKIQRGLWLHRLQVLDKVFQEPQVFQVVEKMHPGEAVGWLQSVLGEGVDPEAYTLLSILLENDRLSSIGDIRVAFADLMVEFHGYGVLHVTTSVALGDSERAEALTVFEKLFQQKLIPHYHVDALIRGGMVGRVDDLVYDGSLKGSLEKLRENLIR
ncbi:MAG TPA: ATP synthase F1 subunit delta [Spirochaetia bacterium]|nr:ATP synthase F1 subunit delta [Spirochaetia bacterium]